MSCPLPEQSKCGNLIDARMSVACISHWYGLTRPVSRVRHIPDCWDW
ncbi:hypothetical protein [Bacteroides cellulosilyticus]